MEPRSLERYAWLSIAAAVTTIVLKGVAWKLTDSVGLLSDAIESFVNLAGALMALAMLTIAARPADDVHAHGHTKAEYFSSAFEGFLIFGAAVWIAIEAIARLRDPRPVQAITVGLVVAAVATIVNFVTARILMTVGRESKSITLEADAHHLMTGVGLVWLTGWLWLDPTIAILVAVNILWTGWQLMRRSTAGLMDVSLPAAELDRIEAILASYRRHGLDFHALRTRQAGTRAFITLHILVPGAWTVQHGHDWSERIEADLRKAVPGAHLTTHIEPTEDPVSHIDRELDRPHSVEDSKAQKSDLR